MRCVELGRQPRAGDGCRSTQRATRPATSQAAMATTQPTATTTSDCRPARLPAPACRTRPRTATTPDSPCPAAASPSRPAHQLIEAEARPAPAHQHEEQDHAQHLGQQHHDAQQGRRPKSRHRRRAGDAPKVPAAEEQDHDQEGGRDHVQEFGDQNNSSLHARIFGVIAADQFLLGLGQIERQSGSSRQTTRSRTPRSPSGCTEDVPHAAGGLLVDDVLQPQRARRPAPRPECPGPAASHRRSTGRSNAVRPGSCICCCWPSRRGSRHRRPCCSARRRRSCPRRLRGPRSTAIGRLDRRHVDRPAARCRTESRRRRPDRGDEDRQSGPAMYRN